MKPKVKKYSNKRNNICTFYIENIYIKKEHIYNILSLFNYGEIIIESDINRNCKWLNKVNQNEVELFIPIDLKPYTEYTEMICLTKDIQSIQYIIDNIIENERDENYIFMVDKTNLLSFNQYLYGYHTYHFINKLIMKKIVDFSICFDFKESEIHITLNSEKYNIDIIINKIKQILC